MFSGSLVALVTPMYDSGEIDYQALNRLFELHLAAGTDGLVILGSTGEGSALTYEEREQFVQHTIDYIDGRLPVIVGVGTNSTYMSIAAAQKMVDLGADGLLMICPYYNKPTQEGIYQHFAALNEHVDCPIILYNHPGRTGSDMLPATVARLAKLPNIVGLKEAVTDPQRFKDLQALVADDFALYSGDDATCIGLFKAGASGVISVVANIISGPMQVIANAALKQDWSLAEELLAEYMPLIEAMGIETNPIPLKWALARINLIEEGIRLPLTVLTQGNHAKVEATLIKANLLS